MDIYKLKWTSLQNSIFRLLCIKIGQTLNIREIARLLKVSPTAVSKALQQLKKEELIKIKKSNILNLIELNRDNQKTIELKRIENLKLIYQTGVSDFLHNEFPGCTIILFGSYSLGDDSIHSDIDIAIIGTKGKELNLLKYNKLLEKNITINYYKALNDIHRHLKENILRGIVLHGGIEL